MTTPTAPKHLSKRANADWKYLHRKFELDDDCEHILVELLEALDRKREAQAELKRDGIVVKNRAGELRSHPATSTSIERDSRLAILRCLRALGLPLSEEADKRKPGRPPRGYPEMIRGAGCLRFASVHKGRTATVSQL